MDYGSYKWYMYTNEKYFACSLNGYDIYESDALCNAEDKEQEMKYMK